MNKRRLMSLQAVGFAAALMLGGCATTDEINQLRADVEAAQRSAEAAQASANSAQASADQAQRSADQALQAAADAQTCCDANTERLNRAFERMMLK